MNFGVTGASGHLGMRVLHHSLERVSPSSLIAITRSPAKVDSFAQRGVTVREGTFDEGDALGRALEGVDRLLLIPATDLTPGVRPRQHRTAIEAAIKAGVRHIIYVSSIGARPSARDGLLETHFATEQAVILSGLPWTLIRMNVYADFLIDNVTKAISTGVYTASGGAPSAYVVRDDLGALSAAALTTAGHEGITYHATGPVSVTHQEIAVAASRATGKPVRFDPQTLDQIEAGFAMAGLPPALADVLVHFQRATFAGAFDLVSNDIGRVTGRKAQSALDFVEEAIRRTA